jgi:hypothetical protein
VPRTFRLILLTLLPLAATAAAPSRPPLIYSQDANDPWNRIFAALFTRTVRAFRTEALREGAPYGPGPDRYYPFLQPLRVSTRTLDHLEEGDRAIEAFYPSFITQRGLEAALSEPRRSDLMSALQSALDERTARPALDRALMQADLWSAFDSLAALAASDRRYPPASSYGASADAALPVIATLIGRLALTPTEIAALPDNYARARGALGLPDFAVPGSDWMEVVWLPRREHDHAAGNRRSARVFIKPLTRPSDDTAFLRSLERGDARAQISGATLIMQTLLVDTAGHVQPSPLVSDIQVRLVTRVGRGGAVQTALDEFELSRRLLLTTPQSGGFVHSADRDPAYLPLAGNDYGFATPARDQHGETAPILGTLRQRCIVCHGSNADALATFSVMDPASLPAPVHLLQPNDVRPRAVARLKTEGREFAKLKALAGFR